MLDIMHSLRLHHNRPLKELEVFSANIQSIQACAPNHYAREANFEAQRRFNFEVDRAVIRIVHGNEDTEWYDQLEALARSIACFKVAMRTEGWEISGSLQSWRCVTAAVCFEQLEKLRGSLPPL